MIIETPKGCNQHEAKLTENTRSDVVTGLYGSCMPEKETAENGYLATNTNRVMSYDPLYDPEIGINSVQGVMCQVRKL
mgnify:CR=1 FL=1